MATITGRERRFVDAQGTLVERLRFTVLALVDVEHSGIVEIDGN